MFGEFSPNLPPETTLHIYKLYLDQIKQLFTSLDKNDTFVRHLYFGLKTIVEYTGS